MQIHVLNGVNLDVLDRRDPDVYGGVSLDELETRIYAWARELGCTAVCRQTNHEGELIEWCHDALDIRSGGATVRNRPTLACSTVGKLPNAFACGSSTASARVRTGAQITR